MAAKTATSEPVTGQPVAVGDLLLDAEAISRFFEEYPDAIAIHQDGILRYVNKAGLALVGAAAADDVLGRSVMDFVHPDSRMLVAQRVARVHAGERGELQSERFMRLDGTTVDVEVLALPMAIDGKPASQLVIRDITERLRSERERTDLLEQSEAAAQRMERSDRALTLAEEAAGLGVWDWTVGTDRLWWTKGLEPLHGIEEGTFRGTFEHFIDAIAEEDRAAALSAIQGAIEHGPDEFEIEFRVALPEGGTRWVLGKGRVFRDAQGVARRMTGIGLNVTERRELREEIARAATRLQLVVDSLPSPVAYIDREGRYQLVSKAHEEWMGRPAEELEGQLKAYVLGEEQFAHIAPFVEAVLRGETSTFETDIVYPGAGARFVRMSLIPDVDPDGRVAGFVSLTTDLSERRRAERLNELLVESGGRLTVDLDVNSTGSALARVIVPAFADQCAIDIIEGGEVRRLAGRQMDRPVKGAPRRIGEAVTYAPEDPRHSTLRDGQPHLFVRFDDRMRRLFARDEAEFELLQSLGATSVMLAPILFGNEVLGVITLSATNNSRSYDQSDLATAVELGRRAGVAITNARLYEQSKQVAAALADANAAKDEFLGLVSHELRNPLTTISGNADALLRDRNLQLPDAARSGLADMKAGADRLRTLVENMLILSRMDKQQELNLEPILVQRIVERLLGRYRREHPGRVFSTRTEAPLPVALGEATCVEQILDNLLSNAIKYSPDGSDIAVSLASGESGMIVSVADRGLGITDTERIFEPFHRSATSAESAPGLGLGLTVCQRLVEIQGGTINARRRDGGGSVFTFTLPLLEDE